MLKTALHSWEVCETLNMRCKFVMLAVMHAPCNCNYERVASQAHTTVTYPCAPTQSSVTLRRQYGGFVTEIIPERRCHCRQQSLCHIGYTVIPILSTKVIFASSLYTTLVKLKFKEFLPARRYASAGLCDSDVSVRLSVCPSVRLSVTRRYCA